MDVDGLAYTGPESRVRREIRADVGGALDLFRGLFGNIGWVRRAHSKRALSRGDPCDVHMLTVC
ncbi:MAG: hypothetical protein QOJ06_3113 [Pseudonocardiales bacterium]|nr:hypothetical protein [Pseudonocardiales bacterium]